MAAAAVVLALLAAGGAAEPPQTGPLVRGLVGAPTGGFREPWHTHAGFVPLAGVRQNKAVAEMEWQSDKMPAEIRADGVTLVWPGAMGLGAGAGTFSISLNGHPVADFDVVSAPTEFPCRSENCRFRYDAIFTYNRATDSSGHFYLTVPAAWVKAGQAATLKVKGSDSNSSAWFALMTGGDVPARIPDRPWKRFQLVVHRNPGTPPPAGEEANYAWYLPQWSDPGIFTPIGPPADPAEVAVSPAGQLMYANDRVLPGTPYVANSLAFGLVVGGRVVPVGAGPPARQSLEEKHLLIVLTEWDWKEFHVRQRCFARPLRGAEYRSGLESTLAWAVFEITNRAPEPQDLAFFAMLPGSEKDPLRNSTGAATADRNEAKRQASGPLKWRDGVLLENDSARCSLRVPAGFTVEFHGAVSGDALPPSGKPAELLRSGGLVNAVVAHGRIEAGSTVVLTVNRVFDFPGAIFWGPRPPKVAAEELTARSAERDLALARAQWKALSAGVSRLATPDPVLDSIFAKAMLDGYFLTKRWDGRYIVFDSVCYRCQWDDASTKWFYALDVMGDHHTAERLLDTVFARQGQRKPAGTRTREGCFSDVTNIARDGSSASWASCNGWALWAMAEHARLANDRPWLAAHKQAILDGCAWILRERRFSLEQKDNPCRGLLQGMFVCDSPNVGYFTYTDAISYLGLHGMARLLSEWGHAEGRGLLDEAEAYRQDIVAAVDRLTDKSRDPWYVPWALHEPRREENYLNGACGPINLAFGGVLPRDDLRIAHVIRWNLDHVYKGVVENSATASMFYSQDLAIVLLEQGRVEEFLRMFYAILAANVSHQTLTTCEWRSNTQPHVHSISSLIRMLRTMLVQERDGDLVLLQGVPRRWLEQGKEIRIAGLPTWYGSLSLDCVSDVVQGKVRLHIHVPERLGAARLRIKLRLPSGVRLAGVTVNGQTHRQVDGEWIVLQGVQGEADVLAKTTGG
jgi:hypothetical protein